MTLFPPTDLPGIAVALGLMVLLAFGFHGLGIWLRKRGHGDRLDSIDAAVTKAQHRSLRLLGPLAASVARFGRAFHTLPVLGSRRQREMWSDLEADRLQKRHQKND